jgi:hypothetical protein
LVAAPVGVLGASLYVNNPQPSGDLGGQPELGVVARYAGCDPEVTLPLRGPEPSIMPGATTPPPSGRPVNIRGRSAFFTSSDAPAIADVVTSLAAGFTVLWYDPSLPDYERDRLRAIATLIGSQLGSKFFVLPWDSRYGQSAMVKPIAVTQWATHWTSPHTRAQFCSRASLDALSRFGYVF